MEEGRDYAAFQFDPKFAESGIEISPLVMPLGDRVYEFPALPRNTFQGLPGLLADSLPDKFGNALIRFRERLWRQVIALGRYACSHALDSSPHADGIADFIRGEGADRIAAADLLNQAFIRKPIQREADRCPRDVQPLDKRQFKKAFACQQLSAENRVAQADQRLVAEFLLSHRVSGDFLPEEIEP